MEGRPLLFANEYFRHNTHAQGAEGLVPLRKKEPAIIQTKTTKAIITDVLREEKSREMPQPRHTLHHRPGNFIRSSLAHRGRGTPIILACKESARILLDVDAGESLPRVEAAEVQVAVEHAVGLPAV